MPMPDLRILLADDHSVVREGLKALILAEPDLELVGEAEDGESAFRETLRLRPDVVVMDISMPKLNGTEATQRLKQDCPEIRVVALTAHEDAAYVRRLLEAGASGYVLKRAAAHVLIDAIRTVAAGGVYLDPSVTGRVVDGYLRQPSGTPRAEVSEREAEVLRLIAQGYSNKEIAARLEVSVKTVETYKARAMEKLGFGSRVDIVRYAVQQGWFAE
jgi:DNA-binding NarL/FixJ family response regulator